jgi:ornithine carbamoyltransferase
MGGETLTLPKDLLDFSGYTKEALKGLLDLAEALKRERYRGEDLKGKSLALLFEKPSLRTRTTLEVAMVHLGGHALYLDQKQVGIGEREPVRDVAKNLERFVEGIAARVYRHPTVEELARHARIPVINALSDRAHPLQALADLLTLKEAFGGLEGLEVAWVGDGNNVLASLLEVATLVGLRVRVATPRGYEPEARAAGPKAGALLTHDPKEAVLRGPRPLHRRLDQHGPGGGAGKAPEGLPGLPGQRAPSGPPPPRGHLPPLPFPPTTGRRPRRRRSLDPGAGSLIRRKNRLHTAKAVLLTLLK